MSIRQRASKYAPPPAAPRPNHDALELASSMFMGANLLGVKGTFQIVFEDGSGVSVRVGPGVDVSRGVNPNPDVSISISEADLATIAAGQTNVEQLFARGALRVEGNLGLATWLRELMQGTRGATRAPGTNQKRQYSTAARYSETLSARRPALERVDEVRRCELPVLEFRRRYRVNGEPVLITEALGDWPLFQMSRDEALERFSSLQGLVRHGDYIKEAYSEQRDFRATPMADFIRGLGSQVPEADPRSVRHPPEPPPYMGNNILPEPLFSLIRLPDYFSSEVYINPRLWVGPAGTLTPLHRDLSDNMFAQVWGEKRFWLAAPHQRENLYAWSTSRYGLDGCKFDPEQPDYVAFPRAREVRFFEVCVRAGELLFIPEGWFHQVRGLSTSLSVNLFLKSVRTPNEQP